MKFEKIVMGMIIFERDRLFPDNNIEEINFNKK